MRLHSKEARLLILNPLIFFSSAHLIEKTDHHPSDSTNQSQLHRDTKPDGEQVGGESNTRTAKFPSKKPPVLGTK
ncbi:hypothetical protein TorRG33x02_291490 [Trema orientale]|uniref:Transmembrane protein n=1 Tax=Trema orientale TaxID=63057 RepID=A0A2P5CB73_TREOI|nr:hypothetical protein TorRG33x02_291490 [Trema orientale]